MLVLTTGGLHKEQFGWALFLWKKKGREKREGRVKKTSAVSVLNGGFVTGARTQRERDEGSDG